MLGFGKETASNNNDNVCRYCTSLNHRGDEGALEEVDEEGGGGIRRANESMRVRRKQQNVEDTPVDNDARCQEEEKKE